MNVLAVDVGGNHVKVLVSGQTEARKFDSGPGLVPRLMVSGVKKITGDWTYDAVSIGYPGPVLHNVPISEPHNLERGWVGFNFEAAFGRPVKLINDAAMQAFGSYRGGKMLFLGLGTGLGSVLITDGIVEPMELGHLPWKRHTYEHYVGQRGLDRLGVHKWQRYVAEAVAQLIAALEHEEVVLGGGNLKKLTALPPKCRAGDNANAFLGGFRLLGQRAKTEGTRTWQQQQNRSRNHGSPRGQRERSSKIIVKRRAWCICGICSRMTASNEDPRSRGGVKSPASITFVYADRNGWPWKNGRQYGAETLAWRP